MKIKVIVAKAVGIACVVCIAGCTPRSVASQNLPPQRKVIDDELEEVGYRIHKLKIDNKWFLKDLGKIVLSEDIPSLQEKEYKYFFIDAYQEGSDTVLRVQLLPKASNVDIGYFRYRGQTFLVWGDMNPDNIFVRTPHIKTFREIRYREINTIPPPPPPPPEEFPVWIIRYDNGRLHLLGKDIW